TETVREYAWERLRASCDESDARRRHALHFLAVAERVAPLLRGPEQLIWLEWLDEERENLRAAFEASLSADEPALARLIGAALARLGYLTMHEERLAAAAELMREALTHHRAADDEWEAAFDLMALGHVQLHRGDPVGAAPLSGQSLALFRRLGDRWGIA